MKKIILIELIIILAVFVWAGIYNTFLDEFSIINEIIILSVIIVTLFLIISFFKKLLKNNINDS